MAKKVKGRLAGDIRASLEELRDFVAGKKTGAIVHRVIPSQTDAREARHKLGLSQREFASLSAPRSAPCASGSSARDSRPAPHAR